jgi:hypothetical protein
MEHRRHRYWRQWSIGAIRAGVKGTSTPSALAVLFALEHEGAASPRKAGFPRLVGPSEWDCFLSVKPVDLIEVTRQPQRATAATIALARLKR